LEVLVESTVGSVLSELVDGFILSCRARGRSPRTVAWYEEKLRRFVGFANAQGIDRLEDRLDRRIDGLQTSIDAMRSDLTQVALAVGVRPRATNA